MEKLAKSCTELEMHGRNIKFMCTDAIWKMLDEMNPNLEKLAGEPYEKIRELKEGVFGIIKCCRSPKINIMECI